jgi:hypothetical protein
VHADAADAAELEEREDEVVVPRVEVEVGLGDDPPRLGEVVIRLLDRTDGGISASSAIVSGSMLMTTRPGCCRRRSAGR